MNHATSLVGILLTFGIPLAAILTSAAVVYAQQLPSSSSSSPAAGDSSSLSSTTISPELKAKMCDPSNPGLKVVNTTEARICGIPKTIKNTTATAPMSPPTTAVSSPSSSTPPPTKLSLPASIAAATKQQKITAS
ncbi:MAG: hypothetical protein ACJ71H_10960, partial [Nitrososphaeraceae archaeon]